MYNYAIEKNVIIDAKKGEKYEENNYYIIDDVRDVFSCGIV